MRINDYMSKWREFLSHSNIAELMESDEARSIFTNHQDMTTADFDKFMKELEKFNTGTYKKEDFDVFLQSYDYKEGRPVSRTKDGISYNPMNGRIYNDDLKYIRTSLRIDRAGKELIRWNSERKKGQETGIKLSQFNKESFYDYILNDQRKK